jgi:phage/plasmid-like protein (TIGR03299 family)
MMYVGDVPWHNLGTKLDAPATAAEAIVSAGLDYQVSLTAIQTEGGTQVINRKAVVRTDTNQVLGVVGNGYVPVQNRQSFGFLDAVVGEGGLRYHTAGALGRGERIWLLAKLPNHIRVRNSDDLVDKFLLLSNAHDGTAALRVYFTPIRVVCQNTLNMAEARSQGQGLSILHKGDLTAKIREAQRVLGLAQRFYDDAEGRINRLAGYYPSQAQIQSYFRELYPDPDECKDNARATNARDELTRLFDHGIGHDDPAIKGTTWAAFNAVTEFVDHIRPSRGELTGAKAGKRLRSIWFGSGANLKKRAWNLALEMAGAN